MAFNMKYIILILFVSINLYSAAIPLKRIKLTSTFGESRKDHFHNGIDLGAGKQDVYAVKDGKIIFYYDRSEFPFDNYPGSGNFVILDHEKTRSYYMHLKDNSLNKTNYQVKESAAIGITSDTGHSYGVHLHFGIEKKQPLEILNPISFFKDHINDRARPRIERFLVKVDDSSLIPVFNTYNIRGGTKITLFVKTYDLIQNNNNKMGPYKITCYINDEKFRTYTFDRLIVKNNYYYLPPGFKFDDTYHDKFTYILGEFPIREKRYDIKIIVEDFFGNSASIERHLVIK